MMDLSGNNFIIIGRAGMDFYPDPPGTRTEDATHFFSCLGGSSANIGVAINRHGGAYPMMPSGAFASTNSTTTASTAAMSGRLGVRRATRLPSLKAGSRTINR